jgi:hypothetical protein
MRAQHSSHCFADFITVRVDSAEGFALAAAAPVDQPDVGIVVESFAQSGDINIGSECHGAILELFIPES